MGAMSCSGQRKLCAGERGLKGERRWVNLGQQVADLSWGSRVAVASICLVRKSLRTNCRAQLTAT